MTHTPQLIRAYWPCFTLGVIGMTLGVVSRFGWDFGWGGLRPSIEHFIGGIGATIVLYGILLPYLISLKKGASHIAYCRLIARITAGTLICIHATWEVSQGHKTGFIAHYPELPRGYIQWEQLLADMLGVLVGITVAYQFSKSKQLT